ncbi:MAG: hypothetical protein IH872_12085 [Chloroflexi bacterium]|nr:hypothetical protein [Chloroflexota bacterium]
MAVYEFVTFLKHRKLSEAYWLLTGPERTMTPLKEWISKDWDSQDDKMGDRITKITIGPAEYISDREAVVEAEFDLLDSSNKIKTSYATRQEMGKWYVYLGLDHPKGSWTFRQPQ